MRLDSRLPDQLALGSLINEDFWRSRQARWGIVLGVLLLSVATAVLVPANLQILVLILPFAILGFFVLLRWPVLGLIFALVVKQFNATYVEQVDVVIPVYLLLGGVWIFRMVTREKELRFVASPSVTAVLYFAVIVILSFLVGQLPWFPNAGAPMTTQIGGLLIFLVSFLAFLLAANQIREMGWLKALVATFLVAGGIFAFFANIPNGWSYLNSVFYSKSFSGSLFRTLLVAFTLSLGLINGRMPLWLRGVMLAIAAGVLYTGVLVTTRWSSGWIPPVIAAIIVIAIAKPKYTLPLTGVAILLIAWQWDLIYSFASEGNEYSTVSRLDAWRIMGILIRANPVLGLGPSNYYFYTPLFNILGWYVQFNSHNQYIDLLAQTGFLGFFCFFWVCWSIGSLAFRLLPKVPQGTFAHAYVVAMIGGLFAAIVAGMLGDWVLPFYYNIGVEGLRASTLFWVFSGGLVALDQMMKAGKSIE